MRDEYEITDTIQIMVDDGQPVFVEDVIRYDVNMTSPEDLLACNLLQLELLGAQSMVHESAKVHAAATLRGVVVGPGSAIEQPVVVTNSLIFPDTHVATADDVNRFIITPQHQVDCRQIAARLPG